MVRIRAVLCKLEDFKQFSLRQLLRLMRMKKCEDSLFSPGSCSQYEPRRILFPEGVTPPYRKGRKIDTINSVFENRVFFLSIPKQPSWRIALATLFTIYEYVRFLSLRCHERLGLQEKADRSQWSQEINY